MDFSNPQTTYLNRKLNTVPDAATYFAAVINAQGTEAAHAADPENVDKTVKMIEASRERTRLLHLRQQAKQGGQS